MSNVVKDSSKLKESIIERWNDLELKDTTIIADAKNHKRKGITSESISRWRKDPYAKAALNEENILWLAWRWGIEVRLMVGTPAIVEGKLTTYVPPYNEKEALRKLKAMFE